ncbi:hypothetical protein [Erythrobacter sp. MTPC3]|uniref:hypothetical protein n=1 Tax=Erythrobacter sp. MTPC3 TaxID=3056564 RepID=UPI0036F3D8FD
MEAQAVSAIAEIATIEPPIREFNFLKTTTPPRIRKNPYTLSYCSATCLTCPYWYGPAIRGDADPQSKFDPLKGWRWLLRDDASAAKVWSGRT